MKSRRTQLRTRRAVIGLPVLMAGAALCVALLIVGGLPGGDRPVRLASANASETSPTADAAPARAPLSALAAAPPTTVAPRAVIAPMTTVTSAPIPAGLSGLFVTTTVAPPSTPPATQPRREPAPPTTQPTVATTVPAPVTTTSTPAGP